MSSLDRARGGSQLGALVAVLLISHGLLVAANLSLVGSRGWYPSPELVLAGMLVALTLASDLTTRVAGSLLRNGIAVLLLALLIHYLVGAVRSPLAVQAVLLRSHLLEVARWSLIGFVTMSGVRFRLAVPGARAAGSIRAAAVIATVAFWVTVFLIGQQGLQAMRINIFLIIAGEGAFYQLFGDYFIIAAGLTLGLQAMWCRDHQHAGYAFPAFVLLVVLQGVASFFLLQLFGSNKAPLVVVLMCGMAVLVARPTHWLFRGFAYRRRALPGLAVLLGTLAFAMIMLPQLDLPPMRIFGFGEETSVLESTSVTSRGEFLVEAGPAQLLDSPLFGNLSMGTLSGTYLHSSLLSLQSHLGVVGTALLGVVLLVGWRRVRHDPTAGVLRVTFWPILATSAVSSFFTWGPLWFVVGGLAATSAMRRDSESDQGTAGAPLTGPSNRKTRWDESTSARQ